MKKIATVAVLALWSAAASAEPTMVIEKNEIEPGLYAFSVQLTDEATEEASWFADMTFAGVGGATIKQMKAFGSLDVEIEQLADTYDGIPGANYSKELDSWVYSPFGEVAGGITEGENSFHAIVGTPGGEMYGSIDLAYVVADGDISYDGSFARRSQDHPVSGVTPEPATMSLLALGGLAVLRRRRRK